MKAEMRTKQSTLAVLEDLRLGALTGRRVELPSAQRQHLQRGGAPIGEVTFDARHRPVSTNASRHFKPLVTVAEAAEVQHHGFLNLKKSTSGKGGASALLVTVDELSTLSVFDFAGEALLRNFDLGHGEGRQIAHFALSPGDSSHFVLTADDTGVIRVHDLKIVAQKERKGSKSDDVDGKEDSKRVMKISTNFSCTFTLPEAAGGEARRLTTVQPVERGSQPWFVAGDNAGGISVFFRNGTLKGRVKVTEDPGGVRGLMRSASQMVLYWSSHSFGYFSTAQIEVQYPPCTGWNSPLFDVAADPTNAGSRVVLALSDGDVIVFTTTSGKSKTCDLSLKFPHVSSVPFKLQSFRGHVIGLPVPTPDSNQAGAVRELFVFNVAAMDAGYGSTPSRALSLQASFRPRSPASLVLTTGTSTDRTKGHVAISYEGEKGVELFELNLKQPAAPRVAGADGSGGGDSWAGWLDWFPKIGVFGVALIGVVFWNVRKVTGQQSRGGGGGGGGLDDFDEESFREKLRASRMKREAEKAAGGDGGGLGLGAEGPRREPRVQEVSADD